MPCCASALCLVTLDRRNNAIYVLCCKLQGAQRRRGGGCLHGLTPVHTQPHACLCCFPNEQNRLCPSVLLTSAADGAYDVPKEIVVARRVSVSGTPAIMPVLNAQAAERIFRVKVRARSLA